MVEIEVQKACQGDCIWLRCVAEKSVNIVIDAGPSTFAAGFKNLIDKIAGNKERIDLLIFSHIDDDHIRGCIRYLQDEGKKIIDKVWINGSGTSVYSNMQEHSPNNVSGLVSLIEEKGISIEYPIFEGKEYNFCEGVIKVIAPTEKEVLNVAEKIEKRNKIQEHASDSFLGNIDEAVDEYKSDTSETNRASIIICVEFENKKLLFSGDSTSENILRAINKYYACDEFEIVKLPHHGSPRNISRELIKQIKSERFIISTNKRVDKVMPNPEILLMLFVLFCCIGIMQIFAKRFGYRIRKKMAPMRGALVQIGDRNLDFEINYSGVREIDECLVALDDMRYALKTSLQKQWETEQEKNRQMSALVHDIKTPLTVVRGNSELLLETELTDEQKNYADYISGSVLQIQNYVQTLIEVTKSQEGISQAPVNVNVYDVLADIKKQTLGLSEVYQHQINWKEELESENSDSVISVVYDRVVRAVMNVVRNAAEHTPKGSVINITVTYSDGELAFTVEDSGSGFTPEGLAHGTEQFFMDDSSRTGGSHYGIGLFFAKKVAEEHGGKIVLANSNETSGAKVEISFTSQ